MKKITLVLILGLLLVSSVKVSAVATDKDLKEEVKTIKIENRQEKISRLAGNLINKLVKSLNNIEGLLVQVKDRLAKMEAVGKEVTAAKVKVPAAESAIAAAKTAIENLANGLPSVITASSTPKALRDASKTAIMKANQEVKKAHQAVVEVIRSVKPGKVKPVTATSTATSTNE
jgi:hypothetical protein